MTNEPGKHKTRVSLQLAPATMEMIDRYRREQDLIPNRTDAIEALLVAGFETWENRKSDNEKAD